MTPRWNSNVKCLKFRGSKLEFSYFDWWSDFPKVVLRFSHFQKLFFLQQWSCEQHLVSSNQGKELPCSCEILLTHWWWRILVDPKWQSLHQIQAVKDGNNLKNLWQTEKDTKFDYKKPGPSLNLFKTYNERLFCFFLIYLWYQSLFLFFVG